jgi:hypothetical protein
MVCSPQNSANRRQSGPPKIDRLSKKAASITHVLTVVGDIIFRFWQKKVFSMTFSVSDPGDAGGQTRERNAPD